MSSKKKDGAPKTSDTQVGVRMNRELRKALEEMADEDDRSLSDFIRHVMKKHAKAAGKLE